MQVKQRMQKLVALPEPFFQEFGRLSERNTRNKIHIISAIFLKPLVYYIDEKRNRAVTNIVDSDARDSGLFGASIHLPMEITLGDGKHSVICSNSVEHFEVILNFLCQKLRHSDNTIALFGFWSGNQILPV